MTFSSVRRLVGSSVTQLFPQLCSSTTLAGGSSRTITHALLQSHGFEPEVGDRIVAFDVDVPRLSLVSSVKEKPVRAAAQYTAAAPLQRAVRRLAAPNQQQSY
jgi:hypothetical protein